MKEEIENTIEETLLGILQVYGSDPNIWRTPSTMTMFETESAVKLSMLTDIVNALCHVDSDIFVLIRDIIEMKYDIRNQSILDNTSCSLDECEVCGAIVNRSANDMLYDTVPLCANHIVVESPMLKKLYSMMSNEDKQHYFDLEKRQEYYNRYVLGKGDDE